MSIRYNNKVIAGMVEDRGGLEVCDIGTSLYIDETKGLRRWLNGQLVAYNKNTAAFFDKLQKIIALNPKLECTEDEWEAIAKKSPYGQCGKFVFYRQARTKTANEGISTLSTTSTRSVAIPTSTHYATELSSNPIISPTSSSRASNSPMSEVNWDAFEMKDNNGTILQADGTILINDCNTTNYIKMKMPGISQSVHWEVHNKFYIHDIQKFTAGCFYHSNNHLRVEKPSGVSVTSNYFRFHWWITSNSGSEELDTASTVCDFTNVREFEIVQGQDGDLFYGKVIVEGKVVSETYATRTGGKVRWTSEDVQLIYYGCGNTWEGVGSCFGSLKDYYLIIDGQVAITGYSGYQGGSGGLIDGLTPSGAIVNGHKSNAVTVWSEAVWTTTDNFYDENSDLIAVKLPRIVRPILGLTDLTQLGELEKLDLEKGKTSITSLEGVQCQYFIQIATGQEVISTLIDNLEIDINNPFSIFDTKYSPKDLNNLSWIKSNSQWNTKDTYPTAYAFLVAIQDGSQTVEGINVKLVGEPYTLYDFVLDTQKKRFMIPRFDMKHHRLYTQQLKSNGGTRSYTIYGDGTVRQQGILTTTGAGTYTISLDINLDSFKDYPIVTCTNADGSATSQATWFTKGRTAHSFSIYVSEATSISWEVEGVIDPSILDLDGYMDKSIGKVINNLYYYIGEANYRNAGLVDVGKMNDALANKQDKLALRECYVVVKKAVSSDGRVWYREYSDGFIEQFGVFPSISSSLTITTPLAFTSMNYVVQVTDSSSSRVSYGFIRNDTNRFTIYGSSSSGGSWYACGY